MFSRFDTYQVRHFSWHDELKHWAVCLTLAWYIIAVFRGVFGL